MRQVNYALYDGNRHDAKQFPLMLEKFHTFLQDIAGSKAKTERYKTTLIFDKGNNSGDNIALVDSMSLEFMGSIKLDQAKDLAKTSNDSALFEACQSPDLEGTKAFRAKREIYGKERTRGVTFNQNLFNSQWMTLQSDIKKAIEKRLALQQERDDRLKGITKKGKKPTQASVNKRCEGVLNRQYLKSVIDYKVTIVNEVLPRLDYAINSNALHAVSDTHLGKGIIITNRGDWTNDKIIEAYRSPFIIENIFKEMKGRNTGNGWPMYHWTDSKIRVHGLYCSVALLIRALIQRRVKNAGINVSLKRVLKALEGVREIINITPPSGKRKKYDSKQCLARLPIYSRN